MINITAAESIALANTLNSRVELVIEKYIETSEQGQMIMNTIPCHFLGGTSCTIYENRFTECREFPHLHKPNFTARLFGTLQYYPMCPINFNLIESLKEELVFTVS